MDVPVVVDVLLMSGRSVAGYKKQAQRVHWVVKKSGWLPRRNPVEYTHDEQDVTKDSD
jgi:hypothetical protein